MSEPFITKRSSLRERFPDRALASRTTDALFELAEKSDEALQAGLAELEEQELNAIGALLQGITNATFNLEQQSKADFVISCLKKLSSIGREKVLDSLLKTPEHEVAMLNLNIATIAGTI